MWFDTHCHLDFAPFKLHLAKSLQSFRQAQLKACFVPAVGPDNWLAVLALREHAMLKLGLGYHPCFIPQGYLSATPHALDEALADLDGLVQAQRQHLSAWGECGLDGRYPESLNHQQYLFSQQLGLAETAKLPLVIHSVRLHDQLALLLKQHNFTYGGVVHAFNGSYTQAKRFVDLGFKLGVGGSITWPRSEKTAKALRRLPLEALVLETDAPDMPLYQMQTEHNSPLHLPIIFKRLCELRSEAPDHLQQALWDNSCALFKLSETA